MTQIPADTGEDDALADRRVSRHVVSSQERFHGRVWDVYSDVVDLGDGQQVVREVIRHPGAVGIIALDDELRILLLRQYRHPPSSLLWEPPAGLLDIPGEDPLEAAARELFEEAGYRASQWSVLMDIFSSPGGSDEKVRLYLARDLTAVPEADRYVGTEEERDMPLRWVPLREARAAVLAGALHNPLAIIGILAAANRFLDTDAYADAAASDQP